MQTGDLLLLRGKTPVNFTGREGAINLEQLLPLAEVIFENWDVEKFDESLLVPVGAGEEYESFYKY